MTVQSKAWVCGRALSGIAASNPAGDMDVCLLWVLSGRGLCVRLITRLEESYRLRCVWVQSWSLDNGESLACEGLARHKKSYTFHSLIPKPCQGAGIVQSVKWLKEWQIVVRFPPGAKGFSRLQSVQTYLGPTLSRIQCLQRAFSLRRCGPDVTITIHTHVMDMLSMSVAIPTHPHTPLCQGCKNPESQIAWTTEFCKVGSGTAWNWHVIFLAPIILK